MDTEPDIVSIHRRIAVADERGFTLPEMITTIVIMGLIVVPLCTVMLQSLTLPGVAGTRTQNSSDRDNAQLLFGEDIAEAAQISTFAPPSCSGSCSQAQNTATNLASTSPTTTSAITISCANTPSLTSWSTISTTWTDSSSGAAHSPTYKLVWSAIQGSTYLSVQLHRVDTSAGSDTTLVSGYCKTGAGADVVASTSLTYGTTIAGNPSGLLNVVLKISLRDQPAATSALTSYNFAGATRVHL
jgi:prepilin-type N-terminal cleavage/methylation domain-containing protein